jgi:hypothetical protein
VIVDRVTSHYAVSTARCHREVGIQEVISVTLQSFNLTTLALVDSTTIGNVNGSIGRLVRWGQNGLAFNTSGGQIFLVAGTFVR